MFIIALGKISDARKDCLAVLQKSPVDATDDRNIPLRELANKQFPILENQFVNDFLKIPYNERKVLLTVNNYDDLYQEHLCCLNTKSTSFLEFPVGHPSPRQLYVAHPYIAHKYVPFKNYEFDFLQDKVREFCQIAQSLGATEIKIECVNSSTSQEQVRTNSEINANLRYGTYGLSGDYAKSTANKLLQEMSQSLGLFQKYSPTGSIELPEKLIWYPNEPSWQRLYEQRLKGNLLQHEERLETRQNKVLNNSELSAISLEFDHLLLSIGAQKTKYYEELFEQNENLIVSIKVKFSDCTLRLPFSTAVVF